MPYRNPTTTNRLTFYQSRWKYPGLDRVRIPPSPPSLAKTSDGAPSRSVLARQMVRLTPSAHARARTPPLAAPPRTARRKSSDLCTRPPRQKWARTYSASRQTVSATRAAERCSQRLERRHRRLPSRRRHDAPDRAPVRSRSSSRKSSSRSNRSHQPRCRRDIRGSPRSARPPPAI